MNKLLSGGILLGLFLASFGAGPALATVSRLNALGGSGYFLEDESGITRWYGSLADYPDHLVIESGAFNLSDGYWMYSNRKADGPTLGLTRHLDADGRWGTAALFWRDMNSAYNLFLEDDHQRENFHLLYGHRLGPADVTLSWQHGAWKTDDGVEVDDHSAHTFGFGARLDLSDRAYLDLAGDWRTTSRSDESPGDDFTPPGEGIHNLRARAFLGVAERTMLVPALEWVKEESLHPLSAEEFPSALDHRLTRSGLGVIHLPDTDHLLMAGLEFEDGERVYPGLKTTWQAWLLRAGFENRLSAWLTVRGGLAYVHHDQESTSPPYVDPWEWLNLDDPMLRVNLGLAVHLGPVDIDLAFGERYPRRGYLGNGFEPQKHWLNASLRWLY